MDPVQEVCAASGVAVFGSRNCAILESVAVRVAFGYDSCHGLTLRYKTDDQMWFHVLSRMRPHLLHRKKRSFVIDNAAEDLADHVIDPEMAAIREEASQLQLTRFISPRA